MPHILPGTPLPPLKLPLVGGGEFDLSASKPENFTLLVFYRGLHCPVCKGQLNDLQDKLEALQERGIAAVAISMDSEERATETKRDWGVENLDIAYGLSEAQARSYGLFLSSGISDKEPRIFSEPGMFLVRPDGKLYSASIQSMPFARPALEDILKAADFIFKNDYPARGELAG